MDVVSAVLEEVALCGLEGLCVHKLLTRLKFTIHSCRMYYKRAVESFGVQTAPFPARADAGDETVRMEATHALPLRLNGLSTTAAATTK